MKSATKFVREKTSSATVVAHSFPYLTVAYIDGGRNINFSTSNVASKWRTPLTKRWIGDISALVPQL